MNNNSRFIKKRLSQIIAAGLLTGGVGMSAHAADFSLVDNELTLAGSGLVTFKNNGLAEIIPVLVDAEINAGKLPDISFALQENSEASGSYSFSLKIEINSQIDSDKFALDFGLIEVGVTDGTIDAISLTGKNVRIYAKKGSADVDTTIDTTSAMLVTVGGSVTIKMDAIVSAARANISNPIAEDVLDDVTTLNNAYEYKVGIIPSDATTRVGHFEGSEFTAFPRLLPACSGFTIYGAFEAGDASTDATFPAAQSESASCAPATGGDPEPEPDPIVDEEVVETIQENTQAIQDAVNSGNVTPAVQDLATNTSTQAAEQTQLIVNAVTGGSSTVDPATLLQTVNTITGSTAVSTQVGTNPTSSTTTQNTLVTNSVATVSGAATVLTTLASQNATLTTAQTQQVNSIVNNTLDTLNNIADTQASTPAQLTELVKKANEITQARAQLGIPATAEESAKVEELSRELAVAVVSKVLGEDATEDQIAMLLQADPDLLQDVIDSSLALPLTSTEPAADTSARIRDAFSARFPNSPTLPDVSLGRIPAPPGGTVNVIINNQFVLLSLRNALTLVLTDEALRDSLALSDGRQVLAASAETSITEDPVTGVMSIVLPGESYAGTVTAIKAVPASVPAGLTFLADGRAVLVRNGYAVELAPVAVDTLAFLAATIDAGFTPTLNNNTGSFTLDLGGNQKFSGAFAYDNLTGKDLSSCGSLTFAEPTGALNSAGYAFVAKCADGSISQRITPYVFHADFFNSLNSFNLSARVDRNTGFVNVAGVGRFKLGFFVSAPTAAETAYLTANGDANGLAFQGGDFNGDGRLDYKVISASGVQLLLGTN